MVLKLKKLETKLDDLSQTSLLNKIIVSGIETTTWDLPTLGKKVLDCLNAHMGLHLNNTMLKTVRHLGSFDQSQWPIELTFVSEVTSGKVLHNQKKLKGLLIFVNKALTKERQEVFKLARKKFDKKNVWAMRGVIYVKSALQNIPCKSISEIVEIHDFANEPSIHGLLSDFLGFPFKIRCNFENIYWW